MSAAAVIAIRRKQLVRRFREAGATDPDHAVTLESLGVRRSWYFGQMVRCGVFRPALNGTHYMDERAATEFLHRQRIRATIGAGALLIVFLVLWALGVFGR